jgi:uncharacterized protein
MKPLETAFFLRQRKTPAMAPRQNGLNKIVKMAGSAISSVMIGLIVFYQKLISPFLPAACRFQPTCSAYGLQAIRTHGPLRGGTMAAWRIARCHPFGGSGFDPVPAVRGQIAPDKSAESVPQSQGTHEPAPPSQAP